MPNIFISYRREDSLGHTGRLFDRLGKHFGKAHVFMDIAGIEPGLDFVEAIDKAVGSCDVFIVVIGKQWLSAKGADGKRRLDNPEDFIRLELATALKRNIRVIPVLIQGATAPSSEDLPEDLRMLSRRQAQEVSDNRFDFDAGELIKTIEKSLKGKYPLRFWWSKIPRWAVVVFIVILFSVAVTILSPPGPQIDPIIEMPNVVGERFEKAKAILTDKGLSVSTSEKQTGEKPPGTVVGQKPEPGTKMKKGDQADLVLALAVRPVIKMPNVVGKRIEEAKTALRDAGLGIPEVKEIKTNERSPGIVLNQTPKPGVEVEPGQKIRLEVAVKSGISVPDVIGKSFDEAKTILAKKGLEALKIEKQTDEKPPGTVVDQNPKQGKEIEKGQKVELVIAFKAAIVVEQYRQMARKLGEDWYASISRRDAKALVRMASIPFFFDNELLYRLEDIENRWTNLFSQAAPKGEDPKTWHLKEMKVQTIAEWKRGGYDVNKDRYLMKSEYKDDDFMIGITVEKDTRRHGQLLYTRNVGGQLKLAGFWD